MQNLKGYRVVSDFAGVKNTRASSLLGDFGRANEMAMKAAADYGAASVYYIDGGFSGQLIVRYVRGESGLAKVDATGE